MLFISTSCHPSNSIKQFENHFPKNIKKKKSTMLGIHAVFVDTSKAKFRFSFYTSWPSTKQWSLISLCLHQDPLRGNGHWFPSIYIKTLFEAMVIDFFFLCLNQDPLWHNGHWFPYVYIKALCNTMIIDFLMFTSRSSAKQRSWIFLSSRPSVRQWSSISLHQDPLCNIPSGYYEFNKIK